MNELKVHKARIVGFEHFVYDIGTTDLIELELDSGELVEHSFNYFPVEGEIVPRGTDYGTGVQLKAIIGKPMSKAIIGEEVGVVLNEIAGRRIVGRFLRIADLLTLPTAD